MKLPSGWGLAAVATGLSAFVSLGFSVASVVRPALIVPGASPSLVGPFAGYALSRSSVIALATVTALARRSSPGLLAVGWVAGGVQALDAVVGLVQGDVAKSAGPAALAAFSAYALLRLGRASPARSAFD